jgi:hypothetical protein
MTSRSEHIWIDSDDELVIVPDDIFRVWVNADGEEMVAWHPFDGALTEHHTALSGRRPDLKTYKRLRRESAAANG